jgi:hypothetical protein
MERGWEQRFATEARVMREKRGRERVEQKLLAMVEQASSLKLEGPSAEVKAFLEETKEEMEKMMEVMLCIITIMMLKEQEEEDDDDADGEEKEELGLGFRGKDLFLEYSPSAIAMATEASSRAADAVEVDQWGSLVKGELHCIPVAIRSLALSMSSATNQAKFKREVRGHKARKKAPAAWIRSVSDSDRPDPIRS